VAKFAPDIGSIVRFTEFGVVQIITWLVVEPARCGKSGARCAEIYNARALPIFKNPHFLSKCRVIFDFLNWIKLELSIDTHYDHNQ
jgi:hypothetical protein